MEEIFLSTRNIANLTKKLIIHLDLDENQVNKDTVLKCKKIIQNSMESVFDKYGNRKPTEIPLVDYVDKLNKKSLSDCIKIFDYKKEEATVNTQRVRETRETREIREPKQIREPRESKESFENLRESSPKTSECLIALRKRRRSM